MAVSIGAEWWRPSIGGHSAPSGWAASSSQDSAVPFAALLISICVLLLAQKADVPGFGRLPIALVVGAFAIAAHCWTRFAAGRPIMRRSREIGLVGALLAWTIATLPLSMLPAVSALILIRYYLKSLGIFWLLCNTITTLGRLRTVAWTLSLTAAPLAVAGVWHFLSHDMAQGRIVGYNWSFVDNANSLALVLNLILPLTVALFLISRRPAARALLAGLFVLDTSAIVVTFSRGGFVELAAICVLYLRTLRRWHEWRWALAALVLAVAAVPLLPPGYLNRLGTIVNIQADTTGSAQDRWSMLRPVLTYTLTHPLVGDGLGMSPLMLDRVYESSGQRAEHLPVHNVYLGFAMDLGWPGATLFLLLLVTSIQTATRVRDRSSGVPALRELSVLAEAIRITLVTSAVAALFNPLYTEFTFYYAPALAVAAGAVFEAEVRRSAGASAVVRAGR